jgi:hypothetical protein
MVSVNRFKIYCENIIANKSQSGNTITPSEFNIAAHQAQMDVFEDDRLTLLRTGESSDFLNNFLTNKTLAIDVNTGMANYPEDFQHLSAIRYYYNKKGRPVERVTNQAWGEIQASELMAGNHYFPKFVEFDGKFRFLPRDMGAVMLDYYRGPQKPIWNYSIVNNVPVYDAVGSVDFEFNEFALKRVADAYILIIAQNIKDQGLMQYVEQEKATDKTIL